jgi:hypothetical protein
MVVDVDAASSRRRLSVKGDAKADGISSPKTGARTAGSATPYAPSSSAMPGTATATAAAIRTGLRMDARLRVGRGPKPGAGVPAAS